MEGGHQPDGFQHSAPFNSRVLAEGLTVIPRSRYLYSDLSKCIVHSSQQRDYERTSPRRKRHPDEQHAGRKWMGARALPGQCEFRLDQLLLERSETKL